MFRTAMLRVLGCLLWITTVSAETNHALNRPVTATGATYPGYPASNLTDGTAETFAHPNLPSGTLGFYFQIDFGTTVELDRIVITGRGDGCCVERLSRYQVDLLADASGQPGVVNWTGVMRTDGSFPPAGGSDTVRPADGSGTFVGRYLRIINASDDRYNPQVAEVAAFGVPPPAIRRFTASAGNITAGGNGGLPTQTTLTWDVTGATALSISPGPGPVAGPAGSVTVQPSATTTYVLTAARGASTAQATLTIGVDAPFTAPEISEFVASSDGFFEDEDGENSDWIEIHNPNSYSFNLKGAHLTDRSATPRKWTFPDAMVPPGGYLVVFASGNDRIDPAAPLHTNFSLAQEGEHLSLRAPGGSPAWSAYGASYPAQFAGASYGKSGSGAAGFLSPQTPGAANPASAYAGKVAEPVFSVTRGFYASSRNLTLTCPTAGATIRYTTNGTVPTLTNGSTYSGAIALSNTRVVRAAAFRTNWIPSRVETHTYVFPAGVIASSVMRTSVTQHATYGPQMNAALLDLPSMSLVAPGTIDGDIETEASIEFLDPAVTTNGGAAGVVVPRANAGVKYFGGAFTDFDKKNFRLAFRASYGDSKLEGDIFPDRDDGWLPADSFDSIELRAGSHDMSMRGFYLSNPFTDDIVGEMGHMQPHGRMVHLYLNGLYHGVYQLRERWGAAMASSYLGGGKDDYESINGNLNVGGWADPGTVYDGDGSAWQRIKDQRSSYPAITKHVDVDEYLDFMIMWMFGNAENEYRATGVHRADGGSGFKFMLNDADGWLSVNGSNQVSAWDGNNNNTGRAGSIPGRDSGDGPASLLSAWLAAGGSDFKIRLADRIQRHLGPGGALSPERNAARLTVMAAAFERPHLAESARWNYRTPSNWSGARDVCLQSWMPGRTTTVLGHFRNAGLFPVTTAPVLAPASGPLTAGQAVAVSAGASSTVHYTTDGSDPRSPGGSASATSQMLAPGGNIPVVRPVRLKLRARSTGGEWSALTEAFFVPAGYTALPAGSVVVSEFLYAPGAGGAEFIELANVSTQAVNLRGASITAGVRCEFSRWQDEVLEPGKRLVLVDSDFSFRDHYGWDEPVAGIYRGNLANEGESLAMVNASGTTVFNFTWSPSWSSLAESGGHSLVLSPLQSGVNLSAGASWKASFGAGGNPNANDLGSYPGANPDGDDNGDGVSNFMHYALAGTGQLRLPELTTSPEGLLLTVHTNPMAGDAEVVMETSEHLDDWGPLTDAVRIEESVTNGVLRSVWVLPAEAPARFVRLKVSRR